jgi:flagellin
MHLSSPVSQNLVSQIQRTQQDFRTRLLQVSTGKRINRASDGPALMAMISRLDAEIRSSAQASRNIGDAISLSSVADASASGITESVQRIRELSVQAGNDTLTSSDRNSIQQEINQLREGINAAASSANFNRTSLLDGSFTNQNFQVGPNASDAVNLSIGSMSTAALGLDGVDVSSSANAQAGITASDNALDSALTVRTQLGSFQNSMSARASNLSASYVQSNATASRWRDADFAETVSALRTSMIRSSSSLAVFAHYNASENAVLRMFA